jgi:hypothetical protein
VTSAQRQHSGADQHFAHRIETGRNIDDLHTFRRCQILAGMRLAIYNFGMFRERADSPSNKGFHDREAANFAAVEQAPGFLGRAGYDDEPERESWGTRVYPRFYVERGDYSSPSTLSLWADLESLMAFTYSGLHAEALRHASEWFVPKSWPPYVLWWVADRRRPDWREGVARLEQLHDRGPRPEAFNFKSPFDAHGRPTAIDKEAVRRLAVPHSL